MIICPYKLKKKKKIKFVKQMNVYSNLSKHLHKISLQISPDSKLKVSFCMV